MAYTLAPLPYPFDALEPHIDARTMEIHHGKHHAAYVNNLNKALEGKNISEQPVEQLIASLHSLPEEIRTAVRNNGGGHANHTLFWNTMAKNGGGQPKADLGKAIDTAFGSFDKFVEQFTQAALGRFGSGWAWLSLDQNKRLVVESTANQDSPIMHGHTPLVGIDVWEHAYYLKYQNRRADYIQAWFNVVDWNAVAEQFAAAQRGANPVPASR